MKKFIITVIYFALSNSAYSSPLNSKGWVSIPFGNIAPTKYQKMDNHWIIKVDRSASAQVLAFENIRSMTSIKFEWKSSGFPNIRDERHEQSKEGDDGTLRVGLILSGPAPTIPFFASAWIKLLGDTLKHPSNELIYLTVASKSPHTKPFQSPYSKSIKTIPLPTLSGNQGWNIANYKLDKPTKVVGLWIMADGDDTNSRFTSEIRNLTLR